MKPIRRPAAWFDRQLAHVSDVLAEADRQHTPEEVAAAMAALSVIPTEPQRSLPLEVAHGR